VHTIFSKAGVAQLDWAIGINSGCLQTACGVFSMAPQFEVFQSANRVNRSALSDQITDAQPAASPPPLEIAGFPKKLEGGLIIARNATA
jgi:hypothetical protein